MKNLILLTFLTLTVACGKESPNQVIQTTKEVNQCEDLKNTNLDGETLNVTGKNQYEVDILTINADCTYYLDYKVYFSVTLNQKGYCSGKGKIEKSTDRINFKPSNNDCSSSEVDTSLTIGGKTGTQFKSELEADELKVLSCDKNDLTNCELR